MDNEAILKNFQRYTASMHGVQSGIAMEMTAGISKETEPKHLRVGVNSAMVEHSALARLLIKKGIINDEEYSLALAEMAEAEKVSYENRLTKHFGYKVTLG